VGLWRGTQFGKLWAAATISAVGFHVTVLAVQLTAALLLGATPFEMGLLVAAESTPGLIATLHAGVIIDRIRRRPVMIAADLGRAALLASIPLAWIGGWLTLGQLYVVAFGVGLLTTLFDVAAPSYLPSLVGRKHLLAANGALQSGSAAVNVIGPNIAGLLVQALGAPLAIAADVMTYVTSALTLGTIRHQSGRPPPTR
jgi:MFS family permease